MNKVKLFFSTLVILLIYTVTYAQVPNLMNYQGVALNAAGTPIANTTIKLKVKIHTGTPTGTVQYYEERSVTTDATGLFDFQIDGPGKIIGAGTLSTVTWSSGDKFLQIEMDPTNGNTFTDMGTQQLVTVPYAKVAEKFTLPFTGTDATLKTFEITNTASNGKAIVANANSTNSAIEANQTGNGKAITASNNSGGVSTIVAHNASGTAIEANGSPISSSDGVLEVNATATAGYAIVAQSGGTSGTIRATNSNTSNGVSAIYGEANMPQQYGVKGNSNNGYGIYGTSISGTGVYGISNNVVGVSAFSLNGTGLLAQSTNGKAILANGATELNGTLKITGGNPGVSKVLTSDASGNATWKAPTKVAFLAYSLSSATALPTSTWTVVKYPTETFDLGNNFNTDAASTDKNTFIAPVSGVYQFSANAACTYNSWTNNIIYASIDLSLNGSGTGTVDQSGNLNNGSAGSCKASFAISRTLHLNAGDKLKVAVYQHNGGSDTIPSMFDVSFSGHLVFAD